MSNETVSSFVDSFMLSASKAEMMTALSAGWTLDEPNLKLTWNGATTGGLIVVGSGAGGGNALSVQAGDTAHYSALQFCDSALGNAFAFGAIGWGNSAVPFPLTSALYLEACDLQTSAGTPKNQFNIVQTSSRSGNVYQWAPRIRVVADLGNVEIYSYPTGSAGTPYTVQFTTTGLFLNAADSTGTIGHDANFNIVFRATPSSGFANQYNCFGGTMANLGGHLLKTGGVVGSQVTRLQVADDGINFLAPLFNSGVAAFALSKDTGWTANADGGDKTKVIPSNATLAAMATALNTLVAGFGDAFVASTEKMKALEAALVALVLPNA